MKKNIRRIYILELIMLIYLLIFKFGILEYFYQYSDIINFSFWVILLIFLIITGGFPQDKKYLKSNTIRLVIIMIMLYFIFSYGIGLFTGFARTVYSHKIIDIIKNIASPFMMIVIMELCRYLILKKEPNQIQKIALIVLMVFFDIMVAMHFYNFNSAEKVFLFLSITLLPCVARESLYTYITYNVSFVPTLILRLCIELYVYFVPILPNFGNYFSSVIGVLFPYLVYKQLSKELEYREKYHLYAKSYFKKFAFGTLCGFMIIVITLVSGFFRYQMIAIASDSMNPIYARGDAIIFVKKEPKDVKENDILVFKQDNAYITHRVMKVYQSKDQYSFITKGDNNEEYDKNVVHNEDVIGVVRYIVKYIGFPTVWFNEQK